MFGGFAGAFFATRQGFISPEAFTFIESAIILAIVVLGGMGSQLGVALAALVMIGGFELFRDLDEYRMLVFGARDGADHGVAPARPGRQPHADGRARAGDAPSAPSTSPKGADERGATPILDVERLTMRFGGLVAVDDVSFAARARRDHRAHRPERRRQDHGLQLHHRLLQADRRARCACTATAAPVRARALPGHRIAAAPASRAPSRTSACFPA